MPRNGRPQMRQFGAAIIARFICRTSVQRSCLCFFPLSALVSFIDNLRVDTTERIYYVHYSIGVHLLWFASPVALGRWSVVIVHGGIAYDADSPRQGSSRGVRPGARA